MGDKPLPTFSFGAAASSSGTSTPSLFGTATNTGSSLFGSNTGPTGSGSGSNIFGNAGGSAGFSFGNLGKAQPASSGEEKKTPFGAPSDANKTSTLFNPSPGGSGANSPFSPVAGAGTGNAGSFGGFSFDKLSQTPAKPVSSTEHTSSTPASNPFKGFGNPSTTPAGAPPAAPAFGASTGVSTASIFNNTASTTAQSSGSTPALAGFSWNASKPSNPAPGTSATEPSKTTEKPLFSFPNGGPNLTSASTASGAPQQPAPTTFTPQAPSPFQGSTATTQAGSTSNAKPFSFGGQQPPPSSTGSTPNIFTNLGGTKPPGATVENAAQTPTTTSAFPSSGPVLNNPLSSAFPPSTSAASNSAAPASATKPPLFGSVPTTAATASSSLFPPVTSSSTTQAGTSPFQVPTPGTSNNATSSLFPPVTSTSSDPSATTAGATSTAQNISTFKAQTSTSGPPPQPQSRLKNKTMDEILTRWASDLTKYTKDFRTHAETVSQWDQILVQNLTETAKIYAKTVTSEKQMQSVEMALSAVEKQQDELEGWLSRYERDVDEMMAKNNVGQEMGGPDQERERTYKLAERLGERLDDMGRDLAGMVEEVNSVTAGMGRNGGRDEPITQIVKILNSHLTQLQEIDQGTATLQAKVAAAPSSANQLGYSNGIGTGDGKAAVEDFYRSYMGRR